MIKMSLSSIAVIILISMGCTAQKKAVNPYPEVKVTDWSKKSYSLLPDFWKVTEKEILTKVSREQFDTIKKYANNENMPDALLLFDGTKLMCSLETYTKRVSSLRVYKVLDCHEVYKGKDYGRYAILAVPYQELYWDKTAKWDTVYFVVPDSVVKEVKK